MSASAPLLTGKNRRRSLQALLAAPLLAMGIAAGAGTAHASASTFTPGEIPLSDGYCAVSGWPHGEIFCGTSEGANFPNGTQEIFGIGKNFQVWTDWGTEARPSGWKQLGTAPNGCDPAYGRLGLGNDLGNYSLVLLCSDSIGQVWENDRSAGPGGSWSGWY